jgi:hypothetical protein
MEISKNHLIIFIAYKHVDIVKSSLDSVFDYQNSDVFVVENKSENSVELENYFNTKDLVGYIQFESNIANSAVTIFIKDFWDLILKYDYVTITDGDLLIADINETFKEIILALSNSEIGVASADLWQGNNYLYDERKGLPEYISDSKNNETEFGCIEGNTGAFFITLRNENIYILKDLLFVDSYLYHRLTAFQKKWFKTRKNLVYHLTWDLYVEGNEYFEYKKQVYDKIFFEEKQSNYTKLI